MIRERLQLGMSDADLAQAIDRMNTAVNASQITAFRMKKRGKNLNI